MMVTAPMMIATIAIILIMIASIGDIVIQVFSPLINCSPAVVHFRLFMRGGCIVAIAHIVAQFLPVVMKLLLALLDRPLVILHIMPGLRFHTGRQKEHAQCPGGQTDRYALRRKPPLSTAGALATDRQTKQMQMLCHYHDCEWEVLGIGVFVNSNSVQLTPGEYPRPQVVFAQQNRCTH